MPSLKKIVIIGPESTGKSTLCSELAAHYRTDWVPEYAREYLLAHGKDYRYEDLLPIAKGQLALEDAHAVSLEETHAAALKKRSAAARNKGGSGASPGECPGGDAGTGIGAGPEPLLFVDTDMYVMKVWCEFVFGKCHSWILDQIDSRSYDGYLLCRTDLPWVQDELREYPDLLNREKLFHIYRDCMINQRVPWTEIGGAAERRLEVAVTAVDRLIAG